MNARTMGADERRLVEAAQQDRSRFAELYDLHFERVYAFITSRVRNRQEAEDLTSEVFQHALANLDRYEWRGVPFAAWLTRIAANMIADRWRRLTHEDGDPPPEPPNEAAWEGLEQRALVFQLVDALPPDQRRVIVQRFVEQKSIAEIARELARTEGAVKQLQFRALESLRARIQPDKPKRGTPGGRSAQ